MKGKMRYKFGHKLREVRERKGYTLKDVATRAEVSESLVSQIERNKVSPSIDTLLLIADILDVDYEYLFNDYRQKRKVSIVRKLKRGTIRRDKVAFHQLSVNDGAVRDSAIEVFLLEIDPGGEKGDRQYGHAGMEFGIILEGSAELLYGHEQYFLAAGDSVYFPSDMPHLLKNTGSTLLQAIWVISPPRNLFRH
ncbi:helix-turn-helix domain-containing protein [Desulforhopalus singaporensis]|uniref:Helix-turn-helix domain-containing protein n=1 Tax=Desulforhopalus singaporensis TaxID=91360 RepID=A0A1H0QVF5_9BACT|nr:XRE family transcriptional regulator [Desulforhopalus singaporensis]SDP21257.1 Helix-turn-helix domain-containing protein [Desulforhopalus singaporensis]